MEKQETKHERTRLEDVVPRSAPFVIFLDPCGACNFKCNFCPCNISDFQVEERHKVMEWPLFEKIAEDLKAFHGEVRVINLYGYGEPLLNPRIADMVKCLKENKLCREVRITTNASLLTAEKSRALIDAGVDLIRVSVEALSTQGYRELCGVNMDFQKILDNMKCFYDMSRGTKSKITAKIISATIKTKKDQQRFNDLFSDITDYHFIEEVDKYWTEFDEIELPEDHLKSNSRCYQKKEEKQICSFPFTDMCIHSNGLVGACCVDWKFATQYGDAKKEHLANIWNGKRHLELQRAHLERSLAELVPFCAACVLKSTDQISDTGLLLDRLKEKFGKC